MAFEKAFILGIDGFPYTLSQYLIEEGHMPNLARLQEVGDLGQMHTTVPDFSCVAWTSFATGVNPGKHGIYGFQDFHPVNGGIHMPTANDCKSPQLWHLVGEQGGRSIVLNLPGTYPATPLRGKMISGFIAVDYDKSFYPPTFGQTLKSLGYRMDLDGQMGLGSAEQVKECLMPVFKARKDAIQHVIENENWDLNISVITETDRLQHFYLHALKDPDNPQHEWTLNFYKELDAFIGEVADRISGQAQLYMVADHGFDVIKQEVYLDKAMFDLGYATTRGPWMDMEKIKETKVLTMDPGRFYINRANSRFKKGFVDEVEAGEIIDHLIEWLESLVDVNSGEKIVSTIRRKEEGFWGDAIDYAPDLVAATRSGYYFKSYDYNPGENEGVNWEANHVWDDAIIYTPFERKEGHQPVIWDLLPTVLTHMGVEVPDYVDGVDLSASA